MIKWTLAAWILGLVLDAAFFDGFLMLRVLLPLIVIGWHIRDEIRETAKKPKPPVLPEETPASTAEVKEEA